MTDQGTRCQICTGCGRCGMGKELEREMKVVTFSGAPAEPVQEREAGLRRKSREEDETGSRRKFREEEEAGPRRKFREEEEAAGPGQSRVPESVMPRKKELAAADLGTTTIAMEWYDSQGQKRGEYVCVNPQRIFGTDVLSRIQAAENPMLLRQMQQSVKRALAEGIAQFRAQGGNPEKLIIAGNTTMLYLLMGYDPSSLGTAPFRADYLASERLTVEGVEAETLPGMSAFVGGDITAGILACGMDRRKEVTLLVDLGTNGEMVLGNQESFVCCAAAAGPAFEGGGDIWGADMIALTARLLELGLVDETGLLKEPYFESGILIGGVRITQERIRSLQMAKAAVCAGIRTLTAAYGLEGPEQIRRVWLAGGLGYFLDARAAIALGLLPRELEGRVTAVGNAALAGARLYGSGTDMEKRAGQLRHRAQVLNLAGQQGFEADFVEAMYLRRV